MLLSVSGAQRSNFSSHATMWPLKEWSTHVNFCGLSHRAPLTLIHLQKVIYNKENKPKNNLILKLERFFHSWGCSWWQQTYSPPLNKAELIWDDHRKIQCDTCIGEGHNCSMFCQNEIINVPCDEWMNRNTQRTGRDVRNHCRNISRVMWRDATLASRVQTNGDDSAH